MTHFASSNWAQQGKEIEEEAQNLELVFIRTSKIRLLQALTVGCGWLRLESFQSLLKLISIHHLPPIFGGIYSIDVLAAVRLKDYQLGSSQN